MRAIGSRSMRGRPLVVLAAMMAGWIGMRFALWPQETVEALERALPVGLLADAEPNGAASSVPRMVPATKAEARSAIFARPHRAPRAGAFVELADALRVPAAADPGQPVDQAAGHDLLWIAAVTRGAYGYPAPAIASNVGRTRSLAGKGDPRGIPTAKPPDRWSFDSWLLWRPDGRGNAAVAPASYGASQAGALLAYRLAPGSRLAPRAYARATGFPDSASGAELAAGVSIRPVAALPLRAQLEVRARDVGGRVALRPAAMMVGGLDREIAGLEADAYGQVGFVGGADATAFADGKLTLRKLVAARGGFRLATGVGAWGGAQEGAARADVGPSASLTLQTGQLTARVEADYRIRVAGAAEPGSGPALTVSASF